MSNNSTISESSSQPATIKKLGITGSTVVYVFPNGNAYANQKAAKPTDVNSDSSQASVAVQERSLPAQSLPISPKLLGEKLVEAKLITPTQREVALYDQQSTGMRLGEILVARGWISEEILEKIVNTSPTSQENCHKDG